MSKNVSDQVKEVINNGGPFYAYADVVLSDGTKLSFDSEKDFYVDGNNYSESGGSGFPLGVAMSKTTSISIENSDERYSKYDFYYARITLYTEVDLPEGGQDRIKEGTFTVIDPVANGDLIDIVAYDDMYKANIEYVPGIGFPSSALYVLQDVCNKCNINLGSADFKNSDFQIESVPDGLTCRQMIGYIAMITGGNSVMDVDNRLIIKSYDFSAFDKINILSGGNLSDSLDDSVSGGMIGDGIKDYISDGEFGDLEGLHVLSEFPSDPDVSTDNVVITGIRISVESEEGENVLVYGTEDYALTIENPLATGKEEQLVSMIGDMLIGTVVRPFSGDFFPDPTIEFMDCVYLIDRKDNVYQSFITDNVFNYLSNSNLSNSMDPPTRNGSDYYSNATEVYRKARQEIKRNKTDFEKAIEELAGKIGDSTSGLFTTSEKQEDGSTIFYLHDQPTLAESKIIWKMTADAFAVSTDGGKTYNAGLMVNGTLIAKIMNTIGINFDWGVGGSLVIRDEDGNETVYMNADTGTVRMNVESLSISGRKIQEIIQEEASKVGGLNLSLTNEYQGISTDYEGNISDFPEVKTTAQVYYGQTDVTSSCIFSIAESEFVIGEWDNDSHTYTVTGLLSDTGWVDITATYLSVIKSTKRFIVSKIKDGKPGSDGTPGGPGEPGKDGVDARLYFLEPSATILKRSKDNSISPDFLEFSAYYRDGNNTDRVDYAGRFVIEETTDGNQWNEIYRSEQDETSVTHYLYSLVDAGDGESVLASDTDMLFGIPRDVFQVRCKLYAAGGTETLIDIQSVAVVTDVDALTQEEIFNLLTNNGEVKGIYKIGNQIYISFTYAKGGTLSLGGKSDGNGRQEIFNENGSLIGYIDNTGLNLCGNDGNPITRVVGGKIVQFIEYSKTSDGKENFKGIAFGRKGMYFTDQDIEGWNTANGVVVEEIPESEVDDDDSILVNYIRFISYPKEFDVTNALENIRVNSISIFKRLYVSGESEFWTPPKLYSLSHVTSGGHLVFASDGATIAYLASSSKRYKDPVSEMTYDEAKKILNIPVVWFKYKDGYLAENDMLNGKPIPGFYAEDVEKSYPEGIQKDSKGNVEDWNYRTMIPAMLKIIQKQSEDIEELKRQIKELKGEL